MVTLPEKYGLDEAEPGDEEVSENERSSAPEPSYEEKTDEPVLVYFQEIRSVPLLDRKGEVEIAKRIEQAEMEHLVFALQSPLLVSILSIIRRRLQEGELTLAEVSEEADKVPADPQEHLQQSAGRTRGVRTKAMRVQATEHGEECRCCRWALEEFEEPQFQNLSAPRRA